jgi:GNAT superfamily N-acetyltransferase
LAALFERSACPCYCRYWHFTGDKNAWLERCAHRVADNEAEMRAAIAQRSEQMSGVVALASGTVVGWMKLCDASAIQKLYDQRIYRGLPCFSGDRSGTLSVGCFLVDPEHRRRNVAHTLLAKGIDLARERGAKRIEAFPRRARDVSDGELWMGPVDAFVRAGFKEVHGFAPYPVLRYDLAT